MKGRFLLILPLLVMSSSANSAGDDWVGKQLRASRNIEILDSLPKGFFCIDGDKIATITMGEIVEVISYKRVTCSIVIYHDFIEVIRLGAGIAARERRGFIKDVDDDFFDTDGN